jgi:hypothetical protein
MTTLQVAYTLEIQGAIDIDFPGPGRGFISSVSEPFTWEE